MVHPSGSVVTKRSFRLYLVWYTGHGLWVVLAVEGASVIFVVIAVVFFIVVVEIVADSVVVVVGASVLGASVVSRLLVVIDPVISTDPFILELVDETGLAVVIEFVVSATLFATSSVGCTMLSVVA